MLLKIPRPVSDFTDTVFKSVTPPHSNSPMRGRKGNFVCFCFCFCYVVCLFLGGFWVFFFFFFFFLLVCFLKMLISCPLRWWLPSRSAHGVVRFTSLQFICRVYTDFSGLRPLSLYFFRLFLSVFCFLFVLDSTRSYTQWFLGGKIAMFHCNWSLCKITVVGSDTMTTVTVAVWCWQ